MNMKYILTSIIIALSMAAWISVGAQEQPESEPAPAEKKAEAEKPEKQTMNIVETAAANEQFSTLVAAIKAADLADALSQEGPYTVFAPTNSAFEALPEGTLESLLEPENKSKLQSILKYHVLSTKVPSSDITEKMTVETLEGKSIEITKADGKVTYGEATVTNADIEASNGVIHVIDAVVIPEEEQKPAM